MITCKITKKGGVGETSSKYGYSNGGDKFVDDLEKHKERGEFLYNEFISFMKNHNATPEDFRKLFQKYYEEFLA